MKSLTRTRRSSSNIRMRWRRLRSHRPYLLHNCCCGVASLHWSWCLSLELGSLLTKLLLNCSNNQIYSRYWLSVCMAANKSGMNYVEMFAMDFVFMSYQINWSGAKKSQHLIIYNILLLLLRQRLLLCHRFSG